MSPAQFRSAIQKAQREQKRAIYNREARKYNTAVKTAVNDYNCEVGTYNSEVRAHYRRVENQGMTITFPEDTPGHLRLMARQIMNSRIVVSCGGPIGYLEPAR